MSKEGYLIYHEPDKPSAIFYCVLGEGKLEMFSRRHGGVLLKEVVLSKALLKVRGIPDADARECPYSFRVCVYPSRIENGRQLACGQPHVLLLSAPSWTERKAWGNLIHAWQRTYWSEPPHLQSNLSDDEVDALFREQQQALEEALRMCAWEPTGTPDALHRSALTGSPGPSKKKKTLFGRALSIKSVGAIVRKRVLKSASNMTFSLPPIALSVTSALQQQERESDMDLHLQARSA